MNDNNASASVGEGLTIYDYKYPHLNQQQLQEIIDDRDRDDFMQRIMDDFLDDWVYEILHDIKEYQKTTSGKYSTYLKKRVEPLWKHVLEIMMSELPIEDEKLVKSILVQKKAPTDERICKHYLATDDSTLELPLEERQKRLAEIDSLKTIDECMAVWKALNGVEEYTDDLALKVKIADIAIQLQMILFFQDMDIKKLDLRNIDVADEDTVLKTVILANMTNRAKDAVQKIVKTDDTEELKRIFLDLKKNALEKKQKSRTKGFVAADSYSSGDEEIIYEAPGSGEEDEEVFSSSLEDSDVEFMSLYEFVNELKKIDKDLAKNVYKVIEKHDHLKSEYARWREVEKTQREKEVEEAKKKEAREGKNQQVVFLTDYLFNLDPNTYAPIDQLELFDELRKKNTATKFPFMAPILNDVDAFTELIAEMATEMQVINYEVNDVTRNDEPYTEVLIWYRPEERERSAAKRFSFEDYIDEAEKEIKQEEEEAVEDSGDDDSMIGGGRHRRRSRSRSNRRRTRSSRRRSRSSPRRRRRSRSTPRRRRRSRSSPRRRRRSRSVPRRRSKARRSRSSPRRSRGGARHRSHSNRRY